MKLSIIIALYNAENTIERALDSIVQSELTKEQLEVIIVDNESTDVSKEKIKPYEERLNIQYYTESCHLISAVKQNGLTHVTGQFFTFLDDDDYFNPDSLAVAYTILEQQPDIYILETGFNEIDFETQKLIKTSKEENNNHWLHGKFYNRMIYDEYGICFDPSFETHEDNYFTTWAKWTVWNDNKKYSTLDLTTYNWVVNNPNSASQKDLEKFNSIFIQDFLQSSTAGVFRVFETATSNEMKDRCFSHILQVFYCAFLYYQNMCIQDGKNNLPLVNITQLISMKRRILRTFYLSELDLIKIYYDLHPRFYIDIHQQFPMPAPMIQSFTDFLLTV